MRGMLLSRRHEVTASTRTNVVSSAASVSPRELTSKSVGRKSTVKAAFG